MKLKSHEQNKLEEGRDFYVLSNANNNKKNTFCVFLLAAAFSACLCKSYQFRSIKEASCVHLQCSNVTYCRDIMELNWEQKYILTN